MFRYYVSFTHTDSAKGFAVASLDVTSRRRITDVGDLIPIQEDLTRKGYRNVKILAFSLYASMQPNPQRTRR